MVAGERHSSPSSPPPDPPPSRGRDQRIALAAVAGAHGIKGEVRLKLFSESVESLAIHANVMVGGVERELISVRDGKMPIARFAGVDDRDSAEALRGQLVEIDRAELPPLEEGEYYFADLIGLTCFTEQGETVGSVLEVVNYGAGDLLDIETVDGKRAMIPFREPISRMEDARIVLDPEFLA